ncbi:hypothetical protein [Candidatus Formimonas warabiya]|nr:hypothetical protein [Candidatus Formimonas warabiya]
MSDQKKEPTIAPGMEDILEQKATKKEKKAGETTRVTTLSWDEVED